MAAVSGGTCAVSVREPAAVLFAFVLQLADAILASMACSKQSRTASSVANASPEDFQAPQSKPAQPERLDLGAAMQM